ncbi:MAG: HAMP domain-containing protein [Bacteroidales bacterium]|nr:HAMP domain-containing protein [Bacteroidales bacterium]
MTKLSFSGKLILVILLACTGAIAIVGSYSFYTAKSSIMTRTFEQLTSVRTIKQRQVEQFFNDRLRETTMFASNNILRQTTNTLLQETTKTFPENEMHKSSGDLFPQIHLNLQEYLDDGAYCQKLILVLPDGTYVQLYNQDQVNDLIENIQFLEEIYIQTSQNRNGLIRDLQQPLTETRRLIISAPVFNQGEIQAALLMEIANPAIDKLMFDKSGLQGLGKTGETFLVGSDLLMRTPSRFQNQQAPNTIVNTEATQLAMAGDHGTKVITDYRGVEVLSSFSKLNIPDLEWVICAEIDLKEATIPVYRIRNNILLVSAGTGIFVLILITLFSKMLTRPIVNLMKATDEIGSGKFNTRVMPESSDEIGKLTLAFNRMARQLQQNSDALKNEKQQRIRSVLDGQEIERQRLSRELHDGLGQSLIAIKLRLESLDFDSDPKAEEMLSNLRQSFNMIIDEVRRISNNLMPAALHEFGLENALRNHCEEISVQNQMSVRFNSNGIPVTMNRKTKTYLYRIAQEALNNVVKHAKASQVKVSLLKEAGSVQLVIEDNGRGIDQEKECKGKGNGLYNMRERVNLLRGTMDVKTASEKGTTISIHLPLN